MVANEPSLYEWIGGLPTLNRHSCWALDVRTMISVRSGRLCVYALDLGAVSMTYIPL